ncbi:hypothetical protein CYMTET_25272 [Cymbomonas tetramitiformis]|uniref:Uncharacterized protein n=1 Tax=Cymbomonas tetramitiformis TaxID=36881 RepID=A0AAE0FUT1_9CHLO|nr:hypothetical protein CYMTET_25272 [Cymbomonas tetramitiformis]
MQIGAPADGPLAALLTHLTPRPVSGWAVLKNIAARAPPAAILAPAFHQKTFGFWSRILGASRSFSWSTTTPHGKVLRHLPRMPDYASMPPQPSAHTQKQRAVTFDRWCWAVLESNPTAALDFVHWAGVSQAGGGYQQRVLGSKGVIAVSTKYSRVPPRTELSLPSLQQQSFVRLDLETARYAEEVPTCPHFCRRRHIKRNLDLHKGLHLLVGSTQSIEPGAARAFLPEAP